MGSLTRIYGDTPRVNTLEALLELWSLEFTRNQLREQAELVPDSGYAAAEELEEEGLLVRVSEGAFPRYRVNTESPFLKAVSLQRDLLERIERRLHVDGFPEDTLEAVHGEAQEAVDRLLEDMEA